jgi:hypothetical protein
MAQSPDPIESYTILSSYTAFACLMRDVPTGVKIIPVHKNKYNII